MTCSCLPDSFTRARMRHMASSGTTRVSDIGWHGSDGARSWSRKQSAWWTSASPCSPASPETTRSATSYLCSPKTLKDRSVGRHRRKGFGPIQAFVLDEVCEVLAVREALAVTCDKEGLDRGSLSEDDFVRLKFDVEVLDAIRVLGHGRRNRSAIDEVPNGDQDAFNVEGVSRREIQIRMRRLIVNREARHPDRLHALGPGPRAPLLEEVTANPLDRHGLPACRNNEIADPQILNAGLAL